MTPEEQARAFEIYTSIARLRVAFECLKYVGTTYTQIDREELLEVTNKIFKWSDKLHELFK